MGIRGNRLQNDRGESVGPRLYEENAGREFEGWLSVVVPAKNEARSLPRLVGEIADAIRPLLVSRGNRGPLDGFEILVVDDGSSDDTPAVLSRLSTIYDELRSIRLASNVGQSGAIAAGFREARGDWIALLDADLQNDPADLVHLWHALPGHDVALGWRVKRQDCWSRRILSYWANRVRNGLLGQAIRDTGCSVRILPREIALRLPVFRGFHRFLGPLLIREGCQIVQVPVGHRPRAFGKSHYHLGNRSIQVIADLLGVAWLMRRGVQLEVVVNNQIAASPIAESPRQYLGRGA